MNKNEILMEALRDFHWMARRYADGRSSYAPGRFNEHVRRLLKAGFEPIGLAPLYARDGMGRAFDALSDEEVAAAERDMPRGHTIALSADEGRFDAIAEAIEKTIADIRLFSSSFENGSASKDFCMGIEQRLRSVLPERTQENGAEA